MNTKKRYSYIAPATEVVHMATESFIAASPVDERQYTGGNGGSGTGIDTDSGQNGDDGYHNGQSGDGTGTRAKGFYSDWDASFSAWN